jgi:hypothetical protein
VSALAHHLEEAGIATTLIALVRLHAQKIRPPRALWVPFELGRPAGPPGDAALQIRIVRAALALLERKDGPAILEDFPEDAAEDEGDPAWRPPGLGAASDLPAEIAALTARHARARARFGRTMVGVSGLSIEEACAFLAARARGEKPEPPRRDIAEAQLIRFAADDLKAFYLEAAAAGEGRPASWQLTDWFWEETRAARVLFTLQGRLLGSEDPLERQIGDFALVPPLYEGMRR